VCGRHKTATLSLSSPAPEAAVAAGWPADTVGLGRCVHVPATAGGAGASVSSGGVRGKRWPQPAARRVAAQPPRLRRYRGRSRGSRRLACDWWHGEVPAAQERRRAARGWPGRPHGPVEDGRGARGPPVGRSWSLVHPHEGDAEFTARHRILGVNTRMRAPNATQTT